MAANKANYLFTWEIHRNRRVGINAPSDVCEKRGVNSARGERNGSVQFRLQCTLKLNGWGFRE